MTYSDLSYSPYHSSFKALPKLNITQEALPNQPLYQSLPSIKLLLHLFLSFDSF